MLGDMNGDHAHLPTIAHVPPEERLRALSLIFHHLPPRQRDEQIEAVLPPPLSGNNGLEGLLGAYRKNNLVGAVLAQLLPGKTAQAWLPRLFPGEPSYTSLRLLRAMNFWLGQQQIELTQMLFEHITDIEERLLIEGGYEYLTDLLYLACLAEEFPTIRPTTELEFLPYESIYHHRLKLLIDATYQRSLDCPKLNDLLDTDQVLLGYQSSGVFRPELWSIVQYNGQDAGCLLLADHPDYDNVELVYMGLAAWARGRKWGTEIARYAQWQSFNLGRARLVLHHRLARIGKAFRVGGAAPVHLCLRPYRLVSAVLVEGEGLDHRPQDRELALRLFHLLNAAMKAAQTESPMPVGGRGGRRRDDPDAEVAAIHYDVPG
jgi:hypothetical protein